MDISTFIRTCLHLLVLAIPFDCVTSTNFYTFNITNNIYCLSKDSPYTNQQSNKLCSDMRAELALFSTNEEYFRVFQIFLSDQSLPNDIWINFWNTTDSNLLYKFQWKNEAFNSSVWVSGGLDNNCLSLFSSCCVYMQLNSNRKGLVTSVCSKQMAFLCKTKPQCPVGAVKCYANCGDAITYYECVSGYIFNTSTKSCTDVDECKLSLRLCQQICINTIGSFYCQCDAGYSMSSDNFTCLEVNTCKTGYRMLDNMTTCTDIDECSNNPGLCQHNCTNTQGSFYCSCEDEFTLSVNRRNCTQIDECRSSPCQQTCLRTNTSYTCICRDGFVLSDDYLHCNDSNECEKPVCQQICNNMEGSYTCSCKEGYKLQEDKRSCVFESCPRGFEILSQNCVDIDECKNKASNNCTQHCLNLKGSYTCTCDVGFTLSADNVTCLDVDECLNVICDHNCTNTAGSYHCTCRPGYYLDSTNMTSCLDYDECSELTTQCNYVCNEPMSTEGCTTETNNCKSNSTYCDQICINTIGSYNCTCRLGYILDPTDHKTCLDIDECSLNRSLCEFNCLNTPGTYYCTCPYGYQLSNNGHSCFKTNLINYCPCSCSSKDLTQNMSREPLIEYLRELVNSIQVDKENLLSSRLRMSSQVDDRPTSTAMGSIGILFIVLVIVTILLSDILTIIAIIVFSIKDRCRVAPENVQ